MTERQIFGGSWSIAVAVAAHGLTGSVQSDSLCMILLTVESFKIEELVSEL